MYMLSLRHVTRQHVCAGFREDQREYIKTVRILQQHKGFVTCTCVVHDETESGRKECVNE